MASANQRLQPTLNSGEDQVLCQELIRQRMFLEPRRNHAFTFSGFLPKAISQPYLPFRPSLPITGKIGARKYQRLLNSDRRVCLLIRSSGPCLDQARKHGLSFHSWLLFCQHYFLHSTRILRHQAPHFSNAVNNTIVVKLIPFRYSTFAAGESDLCLANAVLMRSNCEFYKPGTH